MHDNDALDQLVDKALHSYIQEPPIGMDNRILRSLAEEKTRQRRFRFWLWAIPTPVAAAILLAVFFWPHGTQKLIPAPEPLKMTAPPTISAAIPPVVQKQARPTNALASHRVHHQTARRPAEQYPKLDVFPAPSAPTSTERALLRMAEQLSPEELQKITEFQQSSSEPVSVARLKIETIEIPRLSPSR